MARQEGDAGHPGQFLSEDVSAFVHSLPLSAPFWAYPLRSGITFTYLGVTVDECARVILQDDRLSANMFAAGEVMAGNILGRGYLAGFGLTIGAVFGRIARREAARHANA